MTTTTTPRAPAATAPVPAKKVDVRVKALRRFALSITIFNILGHTVLGFEQAWVTPFLAALTSYTAALLFETVDAWASGRRPEYAGGRVSLVNFLLPAHIVGLASGMLLYGNSSPWPYIFAIVVANASKYLVRVRVRGRTRHVLNPSNLGVAVTLLVFPWIGAAMPYQFTNLVTGPFDWIIPAVVLVMGTLLNAKLTKKEPLILAWVAGIVLQAVLRSVLFGHSLAGALIPLTGVSFILFTNYMITDPGTTPFPWRRQVAFGLSTALVYGVLVSSGVSFGFFFALTAVCAARGVAMWAGPRLSSGAPAVVHQSSEESEVRVARSVTGDRTRPTERDSMTATTTPAPGRLRRARAALNGRHHKAALMVFVAIVVAHWAEHLVQAYQVWVLHMPRPKSLGLLGEVWPWLISSEWLHYGYAIVMVVFLWLLRPGFVGRARRFWDLAFYIQVWHHFEHLLLLVQALSGVYLAGEKVPTSIAQLLFPRIELHLFYNTIVTVPMVIAMWLHLRPSKSELAHMDCSCGDKIRERSEERVPAGV